MIFVLERLKQPAIEAVTLEEMRRHLRVDQTDTDPDIEALIQGAREWVEDFSGRVLIDSTWRLSLAPTVSPFAVSPAPGVLTGTYTPTPGGIPLRRSPILEIVSIASVDAASVESALDIAAYPLRDAGSKWPYLATPNGFTWNIGGALRITFRAGFANLNPVQAVPPADPPIPVDTAAVVPVRFKQAMKLWAEAVFDRDEKLMPLLLDVAERLVKPERAELSLA